MAVSRTVLASGLIQPKHADAYENDLDQNMATLDSDFLWSGVLVELDAAPTDPGEFSIAHGLGRDPRMAVIYMTSGGDIWWQLTRWDSVNLYLVASAAGLTAKVVVW
jgi:hypothetical protein